MDHLYRVPTEPTVDRFARRSVPGVVATLVLSVMGLATPWLPRFVSENLVPYAVVLAVIAFPAGFFSFGRRIHELFLPISVELGERGVRFVWAEKVPFLPWMRRKQREVAWTDLRGIRTDTVTINGVSTTSLVLQTTEGAFEVPTGAYDRSAQQIQRVLLDRLDQALERPAVTPKLFTEICRLRFAEPIRLRARAGSVVGSVVMFAIFIGVPTWLAYAIPFWLTWGLAGLSALLFGGLAVMVLSHWVRQRTLELRSDGLALGPSPEQTQLLRWDTIEKVRRRVVNGVTRGLEVRRTDGTTLMLSENYGHSFDDIARLIDPEHPELVAVRNLVDGGMPLEAVLEQLSLRKTL